MTEFSQAIGEEKAQLFIDKGMYTILDGIHGDISENDGNVTKDDVYDFLVASIFIRAYLPSIDNFDPDAPTWKCLRMAQRVLLHSQLPPKPLKRHKKMLVLVLILVGTITLHCLMFGRCARFWRKAPEGS